MMTSSEIRSRFLNFFKARGHAVLPSASLIPENDPSVLFNTAGMQPLVPYLLGEKHPLGTRLANIQKCVRTGDIDEIGDNTHATFFEMMGNWSLGDYFKKDAIAWSFELLTNKEIGFGLDPQRLYVTCFEGNENAPKDTESAEIWKSIFDAHGVTGERIYFMPAKNNWWSAGDNGPCGPDTEMFYDLTGSHTSGMTKEEYLKADDKQEVVEIWNDVFMEYLKKDGKVVGKLSSQNVDTGSGFERVTAVLQGKNNIFDTDMSTGFKSTILGNYRYLVLRIKELNDDKLYSTNDNIRNNCFILYRDSNYYDALNDLWIATQPVKIYYDNQLKNNLNRLTFEILTPDFQEFRLKYIDNQALANIDYNFINNPEANSNFYSTYTPLIQMSMEIEFGICENQINTQKSYRT